MHVVHLSPVSGSELFKYEGYQSLSQLGQYYSVKIDGKHTRLYTLVNFLQTQNLALMSELAKSHFHMEKAFVKVSTAKEHPESD